MMFMCTSRFEIEDSRRALINEYLSHEEIQASQEEKNTDTYPLEPISDNDEGHDEGHDEVNEDDVSVVRNAVNRAQSKRRQRASSEPDKGQHEEEGEPILPNTQSRHSGRVRKRSRLLDGYEVETL